MAILMQLTEWLDERGALRLSTSDAPPSLPSSLRPSSGGTDSLPRGDELVYRVDWPRLMEERHEGSHSWKVADGLDQNMRNEIYQIACEEEDPPPIEVGNPWGDDEKTSSWDYCAWYRPVHFFGSDAGISIRDACIKKLFRRLAIRYRHLYKTPLSTWNLPHHERMLVRAATLAYFFHEQFHHSMECLGFRLHAVLGRSAYLDYHDKVYSPLFGTDGCLEEALASANMWHRFSEDPHKSALRPEYIRTIREQLKDEYLVDPPGYRMATNYIKTLPSFDRGHDEIMSQMRDGTPTPAIPVTNWLPASHLSHPIYRINSHFWAVVPDGAKSILPVHSFPKRTSSTAELISALLKIGYAVVKGGGKGSHKKLRQSGWPTLILPGQRENLSPGVASSVMTELGLSLKDFQNFINDPRLVIKLNL